MAVGNGKDERGGGGLRCRYCGSGRVVRNGRKHGFQNYLCRGCGRAWTKGVFRYPAEDRRAAVALYCMGLGLKAVGRAVGCHHTTVLKWVRRFADEHRAKPVPRSELSLGAAELARLLRSDECGKARKRVAELSAAGAGSAVPPLLKGCVTDTAD